MSILTSPPLGLRDPASRRSHGHIPALIFEGVTTRVWVRSKAEEGSWGLISRAGRTSIRRTGRASVGVIGRSTSERWSSGVRTVGAETRGCVHVLLCCRSVKRILVVAKGPSNSPWSRGRSVHVVMLLACPERTRAAAEYPSPGVVVQRTRSEMRVRLMLRSRSEGRRLCSGTGGILLLLA